MQLDLGEAPAHGRASQGGAARVQGGAGRGRETRLKASTLALDSWLESPGPGGAPEMATKAGGVAPEAPASP